MSAVTMAPGVRAYVQGQFWTWAEGRWVTTSAPLDPTPFAQGTRRGASTPRKTSQGRRKR